MKNIHLIIITFILVVFSSASYSQFYNGLSQKELDTKIDLIVKTSLSSKAKADSVTTIISNLLPITLASNDSINSAKLYFRLGLIQSYNFQYNDALESFYISKKFISENSSKKEHIWLKTRILENIAIAHKNNGNLNKAIKIQDSVITIYKTLGYKYDLARVYLDRGFFERKKENDQKAKLFMKKSLALMSPENTNYSVCISAIGVTHYNLKNYDSSIYYVKKSISLFKIKHQYYRLAFANSSISHSYIKLEMFDSAKRYLDSALKADSIYDKSSINYEVYKIASEFYEKTGDYKKGMIYQNKYIYLKDSMDNINKEEDYVSIELPQEKETKKATEQYWLLILLLIPIIFFLLKKKKQKQQTIPNLNSLNEFNLTPREKEVVLLLLEKKTAEVISKELSIAINTVKRHKQNIFKKLNISSTSQLFTLVFKSK